MKKQTANQNHNKSGIHTYALLILSPVLGAGSMLILGIFLFFGSLNMVDLGMNKTASLVFDAFLCLMFFLQHSLMIRKWYRQWLTQFIRPDYHPALYSVASGIVLLILLIFWQETEFIVKPGLFISLSLHGIFCLSAIGIFLGFLALKGFDPFGRREIINYMRGTVLRQMPFIVRGPYRWVRHPLYFFILVMIWACPNFTEDRLLFNILWTIWMITGSFLEERDLVAHFGDEYIAYQQQVPMLIPYRLGLFRKLAE